MDEAKKKSVMIGIMVVCLVLAGVITAVTWKGGTGGTGPTGPLTLMCINEDCGAVFELTRKELSEEMRQNPAMHPAMRTMGPPVVTCLECGQQTAFMARTCPQCEAVFISVPTPDGYQDRCPECGFSATEDRRSRKAE